MTQTAEQLAALLPVLGIKLTPEQLEERVITQIVEFIINEPAQEIDLDEYNEDGDIRASYKERMHSRALEAVRKRIDNAIDSYIDAHLANNFDSMVRAVVFPKTNGYGEKKGEPETLLEHFERKAREYMEQSVQYDGRVSDSYSRGTPRLMWMLEKAFKADMETAIQKALSGIGAEMAKQLQETVARVAKGLRVSA